MPANADLPPVVRETMIHNLANLILLHADELAELEAIDNGKPRTGQGVCGRALMLVQSSRAGSRTLSCGDPLGQLRTQAMQSTQCWLDSVNMTWLNIGQPAVRSFPL